MFALYLLGFVLIGAAFAAEDDLGVDLGSSVVDASLHRQERELQCCSCGGITDNAIRELARRSVPNYRRKRSPEPSELCVIADDGHRYCLE